MEERSALTGLRVVDFSNYRTGAQVSQFFADFGADVVHIEPPGGSPLRAQAAWPFWGRGKRSITLDLKDPADHAVALGLAGDADVVIETFRPGVADRLGIGYDALSAGNPGLVYASITGFGRHGPYADLPGYEGIVHAKLGVHWSLEGLAPRPGPAYASASFASYPASQLALQGIFAALYERETSGAGQWVETSLAQGQTVHDTYNWFARVVASRFSDAFHQTPRVVNGAPGGGLSFRLLIALTADGRWLQFSQTPDRLFRAMMKMFGLAWMFDDPEWSTVPEFDVHEKRLAYWEMLLKIVRTKTAAEWQAEFERDPDVWGEMFRKDSELLDHPQMRWNGMVAEVDHPTLGTITEPGPLVRLSATPARIDRPAPEPRQYEAELRAEAGARGAKPAAAGGTPNGDMPLAGVTVIELGTYYAAPYGATLLADMGARVIKLEQTDGDPHRNMLPFPEVAGIKVLQGKECVAVDLATAAGREIAYRIIAQADIVLQSFRAGVAERLGLDAESLRRINPTLIYHYAPGYGIDGPYSRRPAFAPTIGAAAGLAWRNAGPIIPESPDLDLEVIKPAALQLGAAVMGGGNSDGLSAVSAGTAMMLGLVARKRGAGAQDLLTSMLSCTAHALSEVMVRYDGAPAVVTADSSVFGLAALYRLYETAEEWVFLAASSDAEWARLVAALGPQAAALAEDPRFGDVAARRTNDAPLADALSIIFRTRTAAEWETLLRAQGVACVEAGHAPIERNFMDEGSVGNSSGFVTTTSHPFLDEVPRLAPLVRFSRSGTQANGAGLLGQDTEAVMREFGYADAEIADLAERAVIGLG